MNTNSYLENLKGRDCLAKSVDNIETCLKRIDWTQLAQNREHWVRYRLDSTGSEYGSVGYVKSQMIGYENMVQL
jgi:hypothetical protein